MVSSKGIALCGNLQVGDKNIGGIGAGYAGAARSSSWPARATSATARPARAPAPPRRGPGSCHAADALPARRAGLGARHQQGAGGVAARPGRRGPADGRRQQRGGRTRPASRSPTAAKDDLRRDPRRAARRALDGRARAGLADRRGQAATHAARRVGQRERPRRGRALRVAYRIPRVKGQSVTFDERGAGSRTVPHGAHGRARDAALRAADGAGGRRTVVALVEQRRPAAHAADGRDLQGAAAGQAGRAERPPGRRGRRWEGRRRARSGAPADRHAGRPPGGPRATACGSPCRRPQAVLPARRRRARRAHRMRRPPAA